MRITKHFKDLVQRAKHIVISTHTYPDADGIGSQIALCMALTQQGKDVICVNEETLLERYDYLDTAKCVFSYDSYIKKYKSREIDLFIIVDTNALSRIGTRVESLVQSSKELLFIDHHPCPQEFAALHCIDTTMAATGELIGKFIEALGIKFNKDMALALYTAIVIDTSSFRYPTVTGNTHRLIAKLLDTGISPPLAYNLIYGAKKINHMKLLGTVLSQSQVTSNGNIAWMVLKEDELNKFNIDPEDTHTFINHLLILENIKISCMFRVINTHIKISLRSAGDIDVGIMAQALGGGGHNHSSATIIEGKLEDVIDNTISKLSIMLKQSKNKT